MSAYSKVQICKFGSSKLNFYWWMVKFWDYSLKRLLPWESRPSDWQTSLANSSHCRPRVQTSQSYQVYPRTASNLRPSGCRARGPDWTQSVPGRPNHSQPTRNPRSLHSTYLCNFCPRKLGFVWPFRLSVPLGVSRGIAQTQCRSADLKCWHSSRAPALVETPWIHSHNHQLSLV